MKLDTFLRRRKRIWEGGQDPIKSQIDELKEFLGEKKTGKKTIL